jgi:hypothetical protein
VSADATATLVWLAPAQATSEERNALATWGSMHGIRLSDPTDEPYPRIAVDTPIAAAVDDLLERARAAMAAADGDEVDTVLAQAESLLRAHAELPQAAWLMAEVERSRSTRWRRIPPRDPEAADRAWARAEALDGGRRPGLGEVAPAALPAPADLVLDGPADTTVWIDGMATTKRVIALHAGPHAIVATQNDAPVWATWVDLADKTSTLRWSMPSAPPCSVDDMKKAAPGGEKILAPGVRCSRWIAVERGSLPGAIRVAACQKDRCGELVEWRVGLAATAAGAEAARDQRQRDGRPAERTGRRWPTWATWALVVAGVAVAAGTVVLVSGVWRSAPAETRFVGGGLVNGP